MFGNIKISEIIKIAPWIIAIILFISSVVLFKSNKTLNSELVTAKNNIESYQGILANSDSSNKVLKLDIENLKEQNDKVLQKVDSVMEANKIKPNNVKTITAVTQVINIKKDTVVVLKDSSFTTTLQPNALTKATIALNKDSLSMTLDIKNDQYLYIYTKKEYKHKNKNFLQRLVTLDFKKVKFVQYELHNTNDLIQNSDVRVIESNKE